MQNSGDLPFQITKVWAKNFRSIADASVDLGGLTVLVGPNASGKSNVLDILRFIKDALRFDLEAAVSMRRGIDAILRQESDTTPPSIEIGISARTTYYSTEYGFVLTTDSEGGYVVSREYGKVWEGDGSGESIVEFTIEDGNLVFQSFSEFRVHKQGRTMKTPILMSMTFRFAGCQGCGCYETLMNMTRTRKL